MRSVHVAFLRGVNVEGRHSLPMTALAALFSAGTALAGRVPALIAAGISKRFGFESPGVSSP